MLLGKRQENSALERGFCQNIRLQMFLPGNLGSFKAPFFYVCLGEKPWDIVACSNFHQRSTLFGGEMSTPGAIFAVDW